jgi:hypothetical protein
MDEGVDRGREWSRDIVKRVEKMWSSCRERGGGVDSEEDTRRSGER